MDRRSFISASLALLASCGKPPKERKVSFACGAWGSHPDCQVLFYGPDSPASGKPWVLGSPSVNGAIQADINVINAVTAAGWYYVGFFFPGCTGGESFGSRHKLIPEFINYIVTTYGFAPKPVANPQSRGGLDLLSIIGKFPDLFLRYGAMFPVCDPYSYPPLTGTPNRNDLLASYGQTQAWFDVNKATYTPNAWAAGAKAIPGYFVHGDSDTVVPYEANTKIYAGIAQAPVTIVPGYGHQELPAQNVSDLVNFLLTGAVPSNAVTPPAPTQSGWTSPTTEISNLDTAWSALKAKIQ